tara:strand:- start:35 stop:205 length:171 start_codon:yes stop_codon:yes gene_type:complete
LQLGTLRHWEKFLNFDRSLEHSSKFALCLRINHRIAGFSAGAMPQVQNILANKGAI